MKGVLDRWEGNQAVILIEEEKAELILAKEELPEGSKVHMIFTITKENGEYTIVGIDEQAKQEAKASTSDLLAKLRAKSTGSKFKKN